MLKNVLSFKKIPILILINCFTWCSLVEDFNNFILCGSAAPHANTKLPAAKCMA